MGRPLRNLEELLIESLDPRAVRQKYGLPHPLAGFGVNGTCKDNPYADAILDFIDDLDFAEPETVRHRAAAWFLLESEQTFLFACSEAGIDADRLREHVRKIESGERVEIE